jgi:hypothetical protein
MQPALKKRRLATKTLSQWLNSSWNPKRQIWIPPGGPKPKSIPSPFEKLDQNMIMYIMSFLNLQDHVNMTVTNKSKFNHLQFYSESYCSHITVPPLTARYLPFIRKRLCNGFSPISRKFTCRAFKRQNLVKFLKSIQLAELATNLSEFNILVWPRNDCDGGFLSNDTNDQKRLAHYLQLENNGGIDKYLSVNFSNLRTIGFLSWHGNYSYYRHYKCQSLPTSNLFTLQFEMSRGFFSLLNHRWVITLSKNVERLQIATTSPFLTDNDFKTFYEWLRNRTSLKEIYLIDGYNGKLFVRLIQAIGRFPKLYRIKITLKGLHWDPAFIPLVNTFAQKLLKTCEFTINDVPWERFKACYLEFGYQCIVGAWDPFCNGWQVMKNIECLHGNRPFSIYQDMGKETVYKNWFPPRIDTWDTIQNIENLVQSTVDSINKKESKPTSHYLNLMHPLNKM